MPEFPFFAFPPAYFEFIIVITIIILIAFRSRWPRGGKFLIYPVWSTHLRILSRYRGPWISLIVAHSPIVREGFLQEEFLGMAHVCHSEPWYYCSRTS